MKKRSFGSSVLVSVVALMVGCGDDGSGSGACPTGEVDCDEMCIPEADSTLGWVQANIFSVNGCAVSSSCHNGQNTNPLQDLNLTTRQASFDSLVDVTSSQAAPKVLVVPNSSEESYLMNKLLGVGMATDTDLMPQLAAEPLCDAKLEGVRSWINAGAQP